MLGLYWEVILGLYRGSIREILRLYWGLGSYNKEVRTSCRVAFVGLRALGFRD